MIVCNRSTANSQSHPLLSLCLHNSILSSSQLYHHKSYINLGLQSGRSERIRSKSGRRQGAMAFRLTVRVPPNSASLEEARARTIDFFKKACRSIPTIMEIYNLHDIVTVSQLRSTISQEIRKYSGVTNPKVIDMLLFKGMEELGNIVEHAKQRHHIIGQYVVGRQGLVQDLGKKDEGMSEFLKQFYASNYF